MLAGFLFLPFSAQPIPAENNSLCKKSFSSIGSAETCFDARSCDDILEEEKEEIQEEAKKNARQLAANRCERLDCNCDGPYEVDLGEPLEDHCKPCPDNEKKVEYSFEAEWVWVCCRE